MIVLRDGRADDAHGFTIRGVCGTGGLGSHEVELIAIDPGSLDPTNVLHIEQPDVPSGFAGLDGEGDEGDDVAENCVEGLQISTTSSIL